MTTIAFDGRTMAADAQMTGDFIDRLEVTKVHRIGRCLYGACGGAEPVEMFLDWVRDGKPKDRPAVGENFEALEFDGAQLRWCGKRLRGVECGWPTAIGSGAKFAVGAMLAGKKAKAAVRIASHLDPHSGGSVKAIRLG